MDILSSEISSLINSNDIPTIDQTQKFLSEVAAIVKLQKSYDCSKDRNDLHQNYIDVVSQVHQCISLRIFGRENINNDLLCEIIQVDYLHMDYVIAMDIAAHLPEIDFDFIRGFGYQL